MVATAVAATAFTAPAQAAPAQAGTGQAGTAQQQTRTAQTSTAHDRTQQALDALVRAGATGVTAAVTDRDGVWKGTAGLGDTATSTPRGANDRFRIGSVTKTFVATVLLQMEAEGRLDLDDTVEKHLPGLVRGNGNDGRKITVRQLLNHTSGLFNYTSDPEFAQRNLFAPGFFERRYDTHTPRDLVRVALKHRPDFAPGAGHSYSNTGYILAGMIIEKAGGNSYEHEIRERIIKPLKLRATILPGTNPRLPAPSARNYSSLTPDPAAPAVHDVTEHNMTWGWAAGDMISTTTDLNRFFGALMRGRLLPQRQLDAMLTAVPSSSHPLYSGYGLGIYTVRNACGAELWSHSGGVVGAGTEAVTTRDGRHTLTYNVNDDQVSRLSQVSVVDAEFCGTSTSDSTERRVPLR
ncbi:beta-lactamase [Streptomyces clavuligerus]|nr:beta-lactamase [Streptomyces clavuligerus]